jgi:hypothetical protein
MKLSMEPTDLAHWYFRLNGFFIMPNFILHPRGRGSQRTDADILGFRFPYRAEFADMPDFDDVDFRSIDRPVLLCVEVTRGECKLNGPWTEQERGNIQELLRALGPYDCDDEISDVASALYQYGTHCGAALRSSLFCVGNSVSPELKQRYTSVPQKTWSELIRFIHARFYTYRNKKRDHEQWDVAGQDLWSLSEKYIHPPDFDTAVRRHFGLPDVTC